jgi:hypothetical protein
MYKYFINKLKKKIEILFLGLLVLITAISSNYFYSEKNKINNNYYNIIENIYLKKNAESNSK